VSLHRFVKAELDQLAARLKPHGASEARDEGGRRAGFECGLASCPHYSGWFD
jgi:hypothetical protein